MQPACGDCTIVQRMLAHIKGLHKAESLELDPDKAIHPRESRGRDVSLQPEEGRTKKGAMPLDLPYRHHDHENGAALGQASWFDPWVGPHDYNIRTIR